MLNFFVYDTGGVIEWLLDEKRECPIALHYELKAANAIMDFENAFKEASLGSVM